MPTPLPTLHLLTAGEMGFVPVTVLSLVAARQATEVAAAMLSWLWGMERWFL